MSTLRELEAAATPAPWHATRYPEGSAGIGSEFVTNGIPYLHENAALIAAARNALPLLLDVVDAAQKWWEWVGGPFPNEMDVAADAAWNEVCRALKALDSEPLP